MNLVMPEFGLFFWMMVSFGIVLFILKKFAWKPILNALREREESIDKALRSADRAKEEMAALKADNERILKEARIEREMMLREAKAMSDKIVSDAKQKSLEEADKIIETTRQNIETEKMAALEDVKKQIALLSVKIAEKVLRDKFADPAQQKAYVDKLIEEINLN